MLARDVVIAGDEILVLASSAHSYRVRSGEAGLFVVELDAGGSPTGRRSFVGAAGPGDVIIGTSFGANGRTLSFIAVGVVPTTLEPWDVMHTEPAKRDEALRRYMLMLAGDSIELDVQRARPVVPPNALELAPGEHPPFVKPLRRARVRSRRERPLRPPSA